MKKDDEKSETASGSIVTCDQCGGAGTIFGKRYATCEGKGVLLSIRIRKKPDKEQP